VPADHLGELVSEPLDAWRVLTAPDGDEYWRRHIHSRCNPDHDPPITCPWCAEFEDEGVGEDAR
jgi:hypothetical protein